MFGPGHNNEVSTHFMEARCLARDAVMRDLENGNMTHEHHNHTWGRRRLPISRPVILHTDPLWYDATKPTCCWYMSIIGIALQMRCLDWPFRCFLEAWAACAGICWDFGYGWIVHDDCFVQKDPAVCWSNGRCFLICDRCVASRETRADLSGHIYFGTHVFHFKYQNQRNQYSEYSHKLFLDPFLGHRFNLLRNCLSIWTVFQESGGHWSPVWNSIVLRHFSMFFGTNVILRVECLVPTRFRSNKIIMKKKPLFFFNVVLVSTIADQAWT